MFNFDFLEKSLGIVSPPHLENDFTRKAVLMLYFITHQISLPDSLYFSRYWPRSVLQLFVNQVVTS